MGAFQETLTARKAIRQNPVEHYPLLPTLKQGEKIVATRLPMTPLRLQVLEDFAVKQTLLACAMSTAHLKSQAQTLHPFFLNKNFPSDISMLTNQLTMYEKALHVY